MEQGSSMLIRDCYEKLFVILESDWAIAPAHYLLLGTPGIGKSFFMHYLVNRLLVKLRTCSKPFKIVVQSGSQGCCHFLIQKGGFMSKGLSVKEVDEATVHKLIGDPENYYLIDSSLPHAVPNAKTLMVSYPDPRLYEYYDRHSVVKKLYMPTWSLFEATIARKFIFTECDEAAFQTNFEKIGGIPRFILYKPNHLPVVDQIIRDDYIKESLALLVSSKRSFVASLMGDTIYEPNEIVQYECPYLDLTFKHHFVKLASLYVTQIVLRNLSDKQRVELGRMIKQVATAHPFALEKLEFFVQAMLLGVVDEWPRRFRVRLLRGMRAFSDMKAIDFLKLDHVNCGFSRLMGFEDIERLETERRKKGFVAMWGISCIPQPSGIDGVYIDEQHVDLLYMKPVKDRKVSAGAVREVMTLFRGDERKVWIHNLCLEDQFDTSRPIDYEGFPEEISYLDDNVAQFALGLSLSYSRSPSSVEVTEKSVPALTSPRGGTASPRGGTIE